MLHRTPIHLAENPAENWDVAIDRNGQILVTLADGRRICND